MFVWDSTKAGRGCANQGVKMGTTLVGSPDTVAKGIERLLGFSNGGFGGVLFRARTSGARNVAGD